MLRGVGGAGWKGDQGEGRKCGFAWWGDGRKMEEILLLVNVVDERVLFGEASGEC